MSLCKRCGVSVENSGQDHTEELCHFCFHKINLNINGSGVHTGTLLSAIGWSLWLKWVLVISVPFFALNIHFTWITESPLMGSWYLMMLGGMTFISSSLFYRYLVEPKLYRRARVQQLRSSV